MLSCNLCNSFTTGISAYRNGVCIECRIHRSLSFRISLFYRFDLVSILRANELNG